MKTVVGNGSTVRVRAPALDTLARFSHFSPLLHFLPPVVGRDATGRYRPWMGGAPMTCLTSSLPQDLGSGPRFNSPWCGSDDEPVCGRASEPGDIFSAADDRECFMVRCSWARTEPSIDYHDHEWGVPLHDDTALFEFLVLEGAQAGLSWETILRKRARYREVFDRFDPEKVARYDEGAIASLMADPGIIRNRRKIEAAVKNARAFLAVRDAFGSFDAYVWGFVGGRAVTNAWRSPERDPRPNGRIRGHEQGSQEPRVCLRGPHDLLRVHAGGGHGQRPHGGLLPVPRDRLTAGGTGTRMRPWHRVHRSPVHPSESKSLSGSKSNSGHPRGPFLTIDRPVRPWDRVPSTVCGVSCPNPTNVRFRSAFATATA